MNLKVIFRISVILAVLIIMGCVTTGNKKPSENSKIVNFNPPEIGTEVAWMQKDNGKEYVIQSVVSKGSIDGIEAYVWNNLNRYRDNVTVFDLKTNNMIGRWSISDKAWLLRGEPHFGLYRFPLWVGKSYKANYKFSRRDGWSGQVMTNVKVEAEETVTVPAGRFETLRIVQKNQHFKNTYWYSPKLGQYVKYELSSKGKVNRSGEIASIKVP